MIYSGFFRFFKLKMSIQKLATVLPHPIRRKLGRQFYIFKRWLKWISGSQKFAQPDPKIHLPHKIFEHQSILLRKLKAVDMIFQKNKIMNLRLAAEKINRTVIRPGETFSIWRLVGRPTALKGYLPGLVLERGQIKNGIGGGLCQLGNLIYWMVLHTPLTVVERWRHSFDVFPDEQRTLPFGSGATLAYNYIDLQIRNDTDQNFQLEIWLSETHLHGAFLSEKPPAFRYEVIENEHFIQHEPWGGYSRHNRISRRVFDAATGQFLREEPVTENHALMMYQPFLASENTTF